jgi:hypothetical protein
MHGAQICCICCQRFVPHPSLKKRQKTCAAEPCRKELKRRANKVWREQNPGYFKDRYRTKLKAWHVQHAEYKKKYRQEHPEYVKKNLLYQQAYKKRKALHLQEEKKVTLFQP